MKFHNLFKKSQEVILELLDVKQTTKDNIVNLTWKAGSASYNKTKMPTKNFTKGQYDELAKMFAESEAKIIQYVDTRIEQIIAILARNGIK